MVEKWSTDIKPKGCNMSMKNNVIKHYIYLPINIVSNYNFNILLFEMDFGLYFQGRVSV